ncbi:MAG: MCE family protein [Desulfobulbaceae bacterium]|nr:MCE family protein [Desulfobulbaceae bacterium]
MNSGKSKFMVGLFVACGICVGLVAIIWLGMSDFLREGRCYSTYFDESVQGLTADSPVKYRGVSIGRVDRISVAPDNRLIEVILKIDSGVEFESGLVAQLSMVGITGSMFIELDRKKEDEPDRSPSLNFPSEYPIVSSNPSDISELFRGIDDILDTINSLDLAGISDRAKQTLDNVNQSVVDLDLKGISNGLKTSLDNLNQNLDSKRWDSIIESIDRAAVSFNDFIDQADNSLVKIDGIVEENREVIRTSIADLRLAMENLNTFLKKGGGLVDGTEEYLAELNRSLLSISRNLEDASKNLNRGLEMVADQPSQLFFGEPSSPRQQGSDGQ